MVQDTELAGQLPLHIVCDWIGNTPTDAMSNDRKVTRQNFLTTARSGQLTAKSAAAGARKTPPVDPDLARVMETWDSLTKDIRRAIRTIVKAVDLRIRTIPPASFSGAVGVISWAWRGGSSCRREHRHFIDAYDTVPTRNPRIAVRNASGSPCPTEWPLLAKTLWWARGIRSDMIRPCSGVQIQSQVTQAQSRCRLRRRVVAGCGRGREWGRQDSNLAMLRAAE